MTSRPWAVLRRNWQVLLSALTVFAAVASVSSVRAQQLREMPTVESLIGQSISATENPEQAYPEVATAIKQFFVNRNPNLARATLDGARSQAAYRALPPVPIMMAQMYATANQGAQARAELERGVVADMDSKAPSDPEYYLIFGDIAFSERRLADAELLFAKAEALVPSFVGSGATRKRNMQMRAYAGLAAVAESRGALSSNLDHWKTAEKYLQMWIGLKNDIPAAHQRLGRTLFKLNKTNEAYEEFRLAETSDKEHKMLPADVMMGRMYQEGPDPNPVEAKKYMDRAATALKGKQPSSKEEIQQAVAIYLAVAQWALQQSTPDLDRAAKEAAAAYAIDPKSLDAMVVCGLVARLKHDLSKAEQYLEDAYRLSPGNFAVTNNLALVLAEIGTTDKAKLARAVELAKVNAAQYQQNQEAIATYGWVLLKSGKKAEAEQLLNAVVQSGQFSVDAGYYVADVLYENKKLSEAYALLDKLLDDKPRQTFPMRSAAESLKKKIDDELKAAGKAGGAMKGSEAPPKK